MQSSDDYLNVAETCTSTRALGPGLRSALWVQGCPIGCKGCIAPDWIPMKYGKRMPIDQVKSLLLQNPAIEGITISGGEPMIQARSLAKLVQKIREDRDLHFICFTGYRLETLQTWPEIRGVKDLLSQIDVLIDGPYVESLNQSDTFAGSSNQRILTLSDRPLPGDGIFTKRNLEVHIRNNSILTIGIPPAGWKREWIGARKY